VNDSSSALEFVILTLFPRYFVSPFSESILSKAQAKGLVKVKIVDIRDFAEGRHRVADDYPFGGGEGMVLKVEPIARALEQVGRDSPGPMRVALLSPQGQLFSQELAQELARQKKLVLICGHYEGVDERVAEHFIDQEISIGDYVLSGGEAAALVIVETVARLVPGVLGNPLSPGNDSLAGGVLKHPVYTRPADYSGRQVPPVLFSGDHHKIDLWQRKESLRRTRSRRPVLWAKLELSESDQEILAEIETEERERGGQDEPDSKN
jgi:tRNA (guanine37-N1)-methyltransferase